MDNNQAARRPEHRNRLLQGLLRECPGLEPSLVCQRAEVGTELYREGGRMSHVYFPTQGVVSIVVGLRDGGMVDVQTVGSEGMVGVAMWMGITASLHTTMQQARGELVKVAAVEFIDEVRRSEGARRLLNSYAGYSYRFSSQTCACNAHHSVKQRLCRWLLTCVDRDNSNELEMSQAMLGVMLGVRRQSVNTVLVEMHRHGVIEHGRSRILVLDRASLEDDSCECYQTMKDFYARLVEPLL